ncbi:MAG TPA: hypothetical protein VJC37_09490 [Planctomycetota bacterium]|nr:hypothetical protein [Planctomycetota bacterium]
MQNVSGIKIVFVSATLGLIFPAIIFLDPYWADFVGDFDFPIAVLCFPWISTFLIFYSLKCIISMLVYPILICAVLGYLFTVIFAKSQWRNSLIRLVFFVMGAYLLINWLIRIFIFNCIFRPGGA